jgi:PAS domain S-box-containing protein
MNRNDNNPSDESVKIDGQGVINSQPAEYIASHLDAVLNSFSGNALITLDVNGNITSWNGGARKLLGYDAAEIIGRHFSCFYVEADLQADLPRQALKEAEAVGKYEMEGWRRRKDGTEFFANIVIYPVKSDAGETIGFVKLTRDVTQQVELERLREQYNQSQKQETIAQLTGGIAHDFNNLLTVIEAGHQLIRKYADDMRVERILEVNKVAMDKSRRLITQLLAYSRNQVLKSAPTDVNETLSVFDKLIERAVGEHLGVEWALGHHIGRVNVDAAQLQSALLNLVVNARDAMTKSGTVKIFSEMMHLESPNFRYPFDVPAGDYVVIGVNDSGTGMSKAIADRAIEPFFSTKDVGKASGLGLSQCYGFARQSGGTLIIDTIEDVGTTVRILLPALESKEKPDNPSVTRTILLVDDDYAIRSLVGEMLRNLGHTVIEAEDAREALIKLQRDISIDYLFTDIIMPNGINGLELIDEARALRPGLPTLLASGYPREVLRKIADLGDDITFLQKPYTMENLSAHIDGKAQKTG